MKPTLFVAILFVFVIVLPTSCKKDGPKEVFADNPNLRCLVVCKDNKIMEQHYYLGTDSNTVHDVRSVTKSVLATLTGIAIDKGFIPSEDTKIGNYLRAYVSPIDSARANIKIRDVLSMSSGLAGNELLNMNEYNTWYNASNQLVYALNEQLINEPGQVFNYNSGVCHFMSAIITKTSGMSTLDFARQYLFTPLTITDRYWQTDKQGFYNGGAGLQLTPYDMIKIGQLYLNKGTYNGVRVVSEDWITKASSFKIATGNAQPFAQNYGYFWWLGSANGLDYSFANGYGGQFIVIVPSIKLIVVATNNWSGVPGATANTQWYSTLNMIINEILPKYK